MEEGKWKVDTGAVSEDVARHWDERYRREEAEPEREPAAWLVQNVGLLPASGRALDVAMGTGRNALYLAGRGYEVTGLDISPVAVGRPRSKRPWAGRSRPSARPEPGWARSRNAISVP